MGEKQTKKKTGEREKTEKGGNTAEVAGR